MLDDCPKYIKQLSISKTQKFQIRNALEQHMESLYFGPSCVGGMSLATGFTKTLIDKILEHCEHLVSVDAVEHFFTCLQQRKCNGNIRHCQKVFN